MHGLWLAIALSQPVEPPHTVEQTRPERTRAAIIQEQAMRAAELRQGRMEAHNYYHPPRRANVYWDSPNWRPRDVYVILLHEAP